MWADGFSPRQIWRACPCTERTTLSTHVYYTSIRTSVPCFLPNANKVNEILGDQAERAQMGLKLDHVPEGVLLDRFASLGLSVIIPGVLGNLNIPSIGLHHVYPLLLTRFIFTISPKIYIYIFKPETPITFFFLFFRSCEIVLLFIVSSGFCSGCTASHSAPQANEIFTICHFASPVMHTYRC